MTSRRSTASVARALLLPLALTLLSSTVHADRMPSVPPLPAYQQECAACHLAYAPGFLPAASWQRLMGQLSQHFGTDASLDAASQTSIAGWLQSHAGTYKRVTDTPAPQDRITLSPWFVRKHREVATEVWKRPAIKSAANCSACHPQAEQGDFNEHRIRIPR